MSPSANVVSKVKQAARAKALLKSAAGAAKQLEADVTELVTMRAWTVLGYENFREMWLQECGFKWPIIVQAYGVKALLPGMNRSGGVVDGTTAAEAASMLGHPIQNFRDGSSGSTTFTALARQLRAGVPPENASTSPSYVKAIINKYGNPTKRRANVELGAGPNELVGVTLHLPRKYKDAIKAIANDRNTTPTTIARDVLMAYVDEDNRRKFEAETAKRKAGRPAAKRATPAKAPGFWPYGYIEDLDGSKSKRTDP